MMVRSLILLTGFCGLAQADFTLTGNPYVDPGWQQNSYSLSNGTYVRGAGNFGFQTYTNQFFVPTGVNPLTTTGWNPGDHVLAMGGYFDNGSFTPAGSYSNATLGYGPSVTLPPNVNGNIAANTRVISKFGTDSPSNVFSPSTVPPPSGNGLGSHSTGNGGVGSVQVSIASGRFTAANANQLLTPSLIGGTDNVAQYVTVGATGANGIDLIVGSFFPSARYIYTVDSNGFLSTWEVLLNQTMVENYANPNIIQNQPMSGKNWVLAIQQGGGGGNTDGLIKTLEFSQAPAPPAILVAMFGGLSLMAIRRNRR